MRNKLRCSAIQRHSGKLLEQRFVELALGCGSRHPRSQAWPWRSWAARRRIWTRLVLRLAISRSSSSASHSACERSSAYVLLLQLDEGVGHAVELECSELIEGGMCQHRLSSPQW